MLATLSTTFYSCSNETPSNESSKEKRMVSCSNIYDDIEMISKLTYSNNKLANFELFYNEYPEVDYDTQQNITYSDNQVTMFGMVDGSDDCIQTYYLDERGYAKSCVSKYSSYEGEEYTTTTSFKYSPEGYLLSYELIDGNDKSSYECVYENGKMTYLIERYNNSIKNRYEFNYTTNTTNKSKILNPYQEEVLFDYLSAYYAGILGKATQYLPDSYTVIDSRSKTSSEKQSKYDAPIHGTIQYELDNDGYVIRMTQADKNTNSIYNYKYQEID